MRESESFPDLAVESFPALAVEFDNGCFPFTIPAIMGSDCPTAVARLGTVPAVAWLGTWVCDQCA